jgi:hypothetical protein
MVRKNQMFPAVKPFHFFSQFSHHHLILVPAKAWWLPPLFCHHLAGMFHHQWLFFLRRWRADIAISCCHFMPALGKPVLTLRWKTLNSLRSFWLSTAHRTLPSVVDKFAVTSNFDYPTFTTNELIRSFEYCTFLLFSDQPKNPNTRISQTCLEQLKTPKLALHKM